MNFFEQQDRAKRNTTRLIILLALAVLSLIAITTLLFASVYYFLEVNSTGHLYEQNTQGFWQGLSRAVSPSILLQITLAITAVVILGSLFRYLQLKSGGRAVAEAMGGKLLQGNTQNLDERKILNVVEEMAIASGTPVPPIYLIEEAGINAFAAGYHPQDAVIGITRGCIQLLNRDELQGVVAHEFSHIFHGDMRINMRLISLLYGILLLGLIGEFLLRHTHNRRLFRSSRDKSAGAILGIGIGLYVIGYTGTFFGNLIKAAVSRQREFLADASAVQFTRNPDGIAGALKKIGGSTSGSELHHDHAAEYSHMYFGQGVATWMSWMATHPPLEERIKRIQPRWDGEFPSVKIPKSHYADSNGIKEGRFATEESMGFAGNLSPTTYAPIEYTVNIDNTLNHIAKPAPTHIDYAQQCLTEISAELKTASYEPFSARAIVFGLLLDRNSHLRTQQLSYLQQALTPTDFDALNSIILASANCAEHLRLPLIELALPALKQLSSEQHSHFLAQLNALIRNDQKVNLTEWALYRIVLHNTATSAAQNPIQDKKLQDLLPHVQTLLSLLAYAGASTETQAAQSFTRATEMFSPETLTLLPRTQVKLADIDAALDQLNCLKPLQKPQLLKAMSECVLHDGKLTLREAELYRAIANSLDCPIPPLITNFTSG